MGQRKVADTREGPQQPSCRVATLRSVHSVGRRGITWAGSGNRSRVGMLAILNGALPLASSTPRLFLPFFACRQCVLRVINGQARKVGSIYHHYGVRWVAGSAIPSVVYHAVIGSPYPGPQKRQLEVDTGCASCPESPSCLASRADADAHLPGMRQGPLGSRGGLLGRGTAGITASAIGETDWDTEGLTHSEVQRKDRLESNSRSPIRGDLVTAMQYTV